MLTHPSVHFLQVSVHSPVVGPVTAELMAPNVLHVRLVYPQADRKRAGRHSAQDDVVAAAVWAMHSLGSFRPLLVFVALNVGMCVCSVVVMHMAIVGIPTKCHQPIMYAPLRQCLPRCSSLGEVRRSLHATVPSPLPCSQIDTGDICQFKTAAPATDGKTLSPTKPSALISRGASL